MVHLVWRDPFQNSGGGGTVESRQENFDAPMLVPEHASAEDTIFLSALPKALRERAEAFARDVVAPALVTLEALS